VILARLVSLNLLRSLRLPMAGKPCGEVKFAANWRKRRDIGAGHVASRDQRAAPYCFRSVVPTASFFASSSCCDPHQSRTCSPEMSRVGFAVTRDLYTTTSGLRCTDDHLKPFKPTGEYLFVPGSTIGTPESPRRPRESWFLRRPNCVGCSEAFTRTCEAPPCWRRARGVGDGGGPVVAGRRPFPRKKPTAASARVAVSLASRRDEGFLCGRFGAVRLDGISAGYDWILLGW